MVAEDETPPAETEEGATPVEDIPSTPEARIEEEEEESEPTTPMGRVIPEGRGMVMVGINEPTPEDAPPPTVEDVEALGIGIVIVLGIGIGMEPGVG